MYLIQGVYFQRQERLGIDFFSESEGGTQAVIREGMYFSAFYGAIGQDENGKLVGVLLISMVTRL